MGEHPVVVSGYVGRSFARRRVSFDPYVARISRRLRRQRRDAPVRVWGSGARKMPYEAGPPPCSGGPRAACAARGPHGPLRRSRTGHPRPCRRRRCRTAAGRIAGRFRMVRRCDHRSATCRTPGSPMATRESSPPPAPDRIRRAGRTGQWCRESCAPDRGRAAGSPPAPRSRPSRGWVEDGREVADTGASGAVGSRSGDLPPGLAALARLRRVTAGLRPGCGRRVWLGRAVAVDPGCEAPQARRRRYRSGRRGTAFRIAIGESVGPGFSGEGVAAEFVLARQRARSPSAPLRAGVA
jgi:hypothetical protein